MPETADLIKTSRLFGSNARFVLFGGGNTSLKKGGVMWVKASGTSLGTIDEGGFVRMSLDRMAMIWEKTYPAEVKEREAEVLKDMMASRMDGETGRPSVEALLHSFLPFPCVVHLHPALVNGMTCGQSGQEACRTYFPDAVWIPSCNPGFILAKTVRDAWLKRKEETGKAPTVIFLQNHGVFVAGETFSEIERVYENITDKLSNVLTRKPNLEEVRPDRKKYDLALDAVRRRLGDGCVGFLNRELANRMASEEAFGRIDGAFTPDHIVYSGLKPLWIGKAVLKNRAAAPEAVAAAIDRFQEENGAPPKVVVVQDAGAFCVGEKAQALFIDSMKVAAYAESFGGPSFMPPDQVLFIRDWEVESYRAKVGGVR